MKLTDILSVECVLAPMEAPDKSAAIRQLVHVLAASGKGRDEQAMLQAVMEREAIRSTGIGKGLAVPHGKCASCDGLIMALGKPKVPVDFDSKDGLPASVVALLVSSPDQTGPHIQALARISRLMLMDDFRTAINEARSSEAIMAVISRFEV